MVARAKKQLQEEAEAAADMFALPTMSEEEGDLRRARKAKGRCKDRERSLRKKLNAEGAVQVDDKEQEAPSNVQEDPYAPLKSGGCRERERSLRQRKQTNQERGEDKKSHKARKSLPDPSGVWDSTDNPADFIAAMKAAGQKLVQAREQEQEEEEIAKAEEANRREVARRRKDIQAREDELRELHELEALKAEAEKAVAAVKAVTTTENTKPRSRTGSGESTKTVAFADLVHAEPAKDAAESPFDDLYGWVVV